MSEVLSFPGLGLVFELNRVAFSIGGMPIYWYGIIIALAFLAAAAYALGRAGKFGLDADRVMDVILGVVVLGIIGARLYYVAFEWDTYAQDPASIINIRTGGIAIYGGIIGGFLAAVLMCKWRKVKLLPLLDLVAGSLLLGQAIGRWGNFVNMEAFGSNTTVAWGMTSPSIEWYLSQNKMRLSQLGVEIDPGMAVHPTFFYESMWCLLGFLFIAWFAGRRRFDGELILIYLGWYGLGRFFIEGLRTDSLMLGTMRISQIVALLCVLASVFGLSLILSRISRSNDPEFMQLYVETDEGKAVLAGTFYQQKDGAEETDSEEEPETADETGTGGDGTEPEAGESESGEPDAAAEILSEESSEEAKTGESD